MIDQSFYDLDYFECGIETGKSRFQNYRWMPEHTMSLAMTIIDFLSIKKGDKILDFGCAKGYLVKAFRLLHREAYGMDISEYAIKNCDLAVKDYCSAYDHKNFLENGLEEIDYNWCIAKDVLEHIKKEEIILTIDQIPAKKMFIVVPLGENGKYYAPANNLDKSHVTCESLDWWAQLFFNNGWYVLKHVYRVDGIKESYYNNCPNAHGFFVLEKKW